MIKAVTKQILKKNPKMDNCEEAVTSSVFVFWLSHIRSGLV